MPITLDGTKGLTFPSWTTATRPAGPTAGQTGFNTTTGQLESYDGSAWEIYTASSTQGTSGQYLQSAGAGAAPTWATIAATTGALIRAPQILTSGTSYTTPSNCNAIYVELLGGGGGGSGTRLAGEISGAGAAGAYTTKYFTVTGSTAYTIAIGGGGSGGTGGTAGSAGGNTTITVGATTVTATGGTGGTLTGGSSLPRVTAGVVATNGDLNGTSQRGWSAGVGTAANPITSLGGSSPFGTGGILASGSGASANGVSAAVYGSGGSGCVCIGTNSDQTGGSGSAGFIRIWEYT